MKWRVGKQRHEHNLGLVKSVVIVGAGILMARKFLPELRRYVRMERM